MFLSARGGGRGSPRRQEGGDPFFTENPRRGGDFQEGRGAGRVSAANWGTGGGGLNIFFRGRNVHQDSLSGRDFPKM